MMVPITSHPVRPCPREVLKRRAEILPSLRDAAGRRFHVHPVDEASDNRGHQPFGLGTLTNPQIDANGIKTIEELLAFEDPGTELRKIHRVGPRRATLYLLGVDTYIDEFMS